VIEARQRAIREDREGKPLNFSERLSYLGRELRRREARIGYLFILPSLIILGVFVFWPIIQSVILSLQHWQFGNRPSTWAGLDNYAKMLTDKRVIGAFRNTLVFSVVTVPIGLLLSLALALALNQKIPGRSLLRSMFFLPVIGSFAIVSIVWSFLLNPDIGQFAYWLNSLGLGSVAWLRDVHYALPAVMVVSIWKGLGFNMVIFLAGLQGISDTLYEAAKVDGASAWQRFWYVTLPALRPTALFVLVITVISSFQVFDQVYVMTPNGGPLFSTETVVGYIYYQGVQVPNISYAAAIGVVLFVIVFILTLIQLRVLRFRDLD
jgi:multiple sugar transport system permease protein